MAFDVGTAIGYLDLDTTGFKKGFKSALGDLETFSNKTSTASQKTYALGSAMTSAGSTLTKSVTLPLVGIGTAAVAVGNKFESAMSRVQGVSGATGEELKALTDQALELGSSTAFSASEAAAGMENLASAGFTVEEIMSAMPGLLDLAASSGADLSTASEIAASAIRGFGLEATQAGHVADVFAEAAARTNAQTEDMGEAMKYVAPVASAMGQTLEETAAAIGIMSDAGIKGSQAGTALRGAMSRLAKPTDAMCSKMEQLGLSFFDTQGNMLPLNGIVQELETKMAGLTQEQRNNALVTIFGQEALSGILALMDRGSGELVNLTESFKQADGAAAEMAEVMMDNTSGSIEEMMGSIETLAIKIQQVLAPVVTKVVNKITEFINKIGSMDETTLQMIVTIAGVVAALGPVLVVVGKLLKLIGSIPTIISTAKSAFTVLSGVIGGISAPVLAVVAAIAVLVAAFATLWKNNEEFRDKITGIWNGIKDMFSNFFGQITEKINSLGFSFESFGEVLKALWQGLCDFLAPIFVGVFQYISDTIQVILDIILGVVDVFISVFKGDWEGVWNAITGIFTSCWDYIVSWFQNIGNVLLGVLDVVCSWFGTTWESVWNSTKEFFVNIWTSIVNFFTGLWEGIVGAVQTAWNSIVGVLSTVSSWVYNNVVSPVQNVFEGMWNGLKTGAQSAWNGIKSVFSTVATFFGNIFKGAWEKVKAVFSTGGKIFDGIKDGIVNAFKTVVNTIIKGINTVVAIPFDGLNGILNKLSNLDILGVKPFTWLTWRASIPKIPMLAEGAVIDANKPFLAILGDQKHGTNIEAPLSTIQEAVSLVLDGFAKRLTSLQEVTVVILGDILQAVLGFDTLAEKIQSLRDTVDRVSFSGGDFSALSRNGQLFDYVLLAQHIADALRDAPIQPQVNVEMRDGDVFLDKERVGRTVAPVVSRVIVQNIPR